MTNQAPFIYGLNIKNSLPEMSFPLGKGSVSFEGDGELIKTEQGAILKLKGNGILLTNLNGEKIEDSIIVEAAENAHLSEKIIGTGHLERGYTYHLQKDASFSREIQTGESVLILRTDVETESNIDIKEVVLSGSFLKSDIYITLNGEHTKARIWSASSPRKEIVDQYHSIFQKGNHTTAEILSKNLVGEEAKSIYRAFIKVAPRAKGTTTQQKALFLQLGQKAEVDAIPSLDIGSLESKASHAVGITRLREKDLYYLTLRGMDEQSAHRFAQMGFLGRDIVSETQSEYMLLKNI